MIRSIDSQVAAGGVPNTARAVFEAVAYADVFDYSLTIDEIVRFAPYVVMSRQEVENGIDQLSSVLETDGTFVYCRGRANLVPRRVRRQIHAYKAWRHARAYAGAFWAIPFVQMVAVTGALAADNVGPEDDIDFLIVVAPGRLWLTRAMILAVCRVARVLGDVLCPNYLITTRALTIDAHDLYTAHELAHMVPLHGREIVERLRNHNTWCHAFLPNARPNGLLGASDRLAPGLRLLKSTGETLLSRRVVNRLENWEQTRKIRRLQQASPQDTAETHYSADVCKGHDCGHGARIMRLWSKRVSELDSCFVSGSTCSREREER